MFKKLGIAAALATAIALPASAQDFGSKADIDFANQLWSALQTARLVGPDRINVQPFEGNEPHGAIQQAYATTVAVGGRTARVLVKANHGGPDVDVSAVYDNPNKHLGAYTVMFKREAGYDSENKDWFWAKYNPAGELDKNPKGAAIAGRFMKGADKGCIACHTAAGGEDLETLTSK